MAVQKKDTKTAAPKKAATSSKVVTPKTGVTKAAASATATTKTERPSRRELQGTVISNKMTKTIVIKVDRHIKNALYKKYVLSTKKYMAHDEKQEAKVGDLVEVVETRPLSRNKRWDLKRVVRRATQSGAIAQG